MRRAARVDANQADIVRDLRRLGYSVKVTSTLKGFCDIVVGTDKKNFFFEIKDPAQPPSGRVLTPDEQSFHSSWRGQIDVILTTEDALEIMSDPT